MRAGMCGKKEEEYRERFNPSEFEPPLSSISVTIHTPGFHQSSYSNYKFFLQYLNPIPFLVQDLIRVGMRRLP
jgi:hypothetical protein